MKIFEDVLSFEVCICDTLSVVRHGTDCDMHYNEPKKESLTATEFDFVSEYIFLTSAVETKQNEKNKIIFSKIIIALFNFNKMLH